MIVLGVFCALGVSFGAFWAGFFLGANYSND